MGRAFYTLSFALAGGVLCSSKESPILGGVGFCAGYLCGGYYYHHSFLTTLEKIKRNMKEILEYGVNSTFHMEFERFNLHQGYDEYKRIESLVDQLRSNGMFSTSHQLYNSCSIATKKYAQLI